MKVSTRGRYGLRALVDMTIHSNNAPVSLVQVANRQKISLNYLEQVFGTLRKAGIVVSVKGAGGGYKLARDSESITVKEVLEALEGTFSIIDRIPGEEQDAVQEAIEKLVWSRIDETVNTFLEQKTLKMLTDVVSKYLTKIGFTLGFSIGEKTVTLTKCAFDITLPEVKTETFMIDTVGSKVILY